MIIVVILGMLVLASCIGDDDTSPEGNDIIDTQVSWTTIESPTPSDVYKKLLGGFVNVTKDFSSKKLKSSPRISSNLNLKINLNDKTYWANFKINYNNLSKEEAMFSLEVSSVENSYEDVTFGLYLYNQELFVSLGTTKFKTKFPVTMWGDLFPFNLDTFDDAKAVSEASTLLQSVIELTSEGIDGQTRLNGTVSENKYSFEVNVAKTLEKLMNVVKNIDEKDNTTVNTEKVNKIVSNVLGINQEDIEQNNFPSYSFKVYFETIDTNIGNCTVDIFLDQNDEFANTLFDGEDVNVKIELSEMNIGKEPIPIDFINNKEHQAEFLNYSDGNYTLKFVVDDAIKTINKEFNITEDYDIVLSAKIYQKDEADNFFFIEYFDKEHANLLKAFYVYQNEWYYFDKIDGTLQCVYKADIDLNEVASRVANNNLSAENPAQFDVLNFATYLVGALHVGTKNIIYNFNETFYTDAWYNYNDMLVYINSLYEEDIFAIEEIANFENFISKCDTLVLLPYKKFIFVDDDQDQDLLDSINRITTAVPLNVLTPVETDVVSGGEG